MRAIIVLATAAPVLALAQGTPPGAEAVRQTRTATSFFHEDGRWAALQRARAQETPPMGAQYAIKATVHGIGDAVHETITLLAVRHVFKNLRKSSKTDDGVWPFIRGISWNDDPCGQLFDSWTQPSHGVYWVKDFLLAQHRSSRSAAPGWLGSMVGCQRLEQSHFGELQFLHGMATKPGVPAKETLEHMIAWARFCWLVIDEVDGRQPVRVALRDTPQIAGLFPEDLTVGGLFVPGETGRISRDLALKRIALASLLHMIQDSHARGHVDRGSDGKIRTFLTYVGQDHDKHGAYDSWPEDASDDLEKKIKGLPGGMDALQHTARLLELSKLPTRWPVVEKVLREEVWPLAGNARPSSAAISGP